MGLTCTKFLASQARSLNPVGRTREAHTRSLCALYAHLRNEISAAQRPRVSEPVRVTPNQVLSVFDIETGIIPLDDITGYRVYPDPFPLARVRDA